MSLVTWAPKQRAAEPFIDKESSVGHINQTVKAFYGKAKKELKGKYAAFKKLCENQVNCF